MKSWSKLIALLVVLAAVQATAEAQTPEDKATAEVLFEDARKLMEAKNYSAACPKLEASQRLDPGVGTLLNLAACYELSLRTASAFATYREVETQARREGQKAREKYARDKANALGKLVPKVVITAAATPGLVIKRDGVVVDPALLGTALSMDPGGHIIEASAPGFKPWRIDLQAQEGKQTAVEIPALEAEPVTRIEPTPSPTPSPSASPGPTPSASPSPGPSTGAGPVRRPRRKWAYVVGGVGLATLGAGIVFGVMARSSWSTAQDHCDADLDCDRTGFDAGQDADSQATLSTVLVSVGAGLTVAGVVLWLTAPRVRSRERLTGLAPAPIGDVGLTWQERF